MGKAGEAPQVLKGLQACATGTAMVECRWVFEVLAGAHNQHCHGGVQVGV